MRPLLAHVPVGTFNFDFAVTAVDNSAWVTVIGQIPASCTAIQILNTSSAIIRISNGAAGNETGNDPITGKSNEYPIKLLPGQLSEVLPFEMTRGSRLSARAQTAIPADEGELVINLFG
jgi:hypothetical protein